MAEEFQESEVIFSDYDYCSNNNEDNNNCYFSYQEMVMPTHGNSNNNHGACVARGKKKKKKKRTKPAANSLPVNINIPDNIFQYVDTDEFEEEYEDGEIIPPHVIVGRRIAGKMAFSLCTGNGRTLKGRDLSQVRNSILRMTGFLET